MPKQRTLIQRINPFAAANPETYEITSSFGNGAEAKAGGKEALVVAAGNHSYARMEEGNSAQAVVAVGNRCMAECRDEYAEMAAVGLAPRAVSYAESCPAVSVGFGPTSEHKGVRGVAVCIGSEATASAGPEGVLIFVTPNHRYSLVSVFYVGEDGIEPYVPYYYDPSMDKPVRADLDPEWDYVTEKEHREMTVAAAADDTLPVSV